MISIDDVVERSEIAAHGVDLKVHTVSNNQSLPSHSTISGEVIWLTKNSPSTGMNDHPISPSIGVLYGVSPP